MAQTTILGLEFGSDYDAVFDQLSDRFGKNAVMKIDGEHIQVKDMVYNVNDIKINNITCCILNNFSI